MLRFDSQNFPVNHLYLLQWTGFASVTLSKQKIVGWVKTGGSTKKQNTKRVFKETSDIHVDPPREGPTTRSMKRRVTKDSSCLHGVHSSISVFTVNLLCYVMVRYGRLSVLEV